MAINGGSSAFDEETPVLKTSTRAARDSDPVRKQREHILAMQSELALLDMTAPNHPDMASKRKALQLAYIDLGVSGFGE